MTTKNSVVVANYFGQPMERDQAIRLINLWRKNNKSKWVIMGFNVGGVDYSIKLFDLYIQRLTNQDTGVHDGIDAQSVKDFNTFLDSQIA